MLTLQELIKERRSEPWRNDLRKSLSNKERIGLEPQYISELHQEPVISSLYVEDKQVFTDDEALAEARRCLDCPTPGCVQACPAHIHIPSFIKHIERGELRESWDILRESSTLSAICSRVCDQDSQCEGGCIYKVSLKKRSVKIGALERYVATFERHSRAEIGSLASPLPSNGYKVAIIGAGPSGLAAAHDLALWGYEVTVFERMEAPGGVMRLGIPRFRLPSDVIDDEVSRLMAYGVKFVYGVEIGRDKTIQELKSEGFEVIFLGTGATESNLMRIEGEDLPEVLPWNKYLCVANMSEPEDAELALKPYRAKKVAIIGGGNTAMDAARTARRIGADQVIVVYRRGLEEMPACKDEVEHAQAEGIEFMTLHNPERYIANEEGHLVAMELMEMTLTEPDESGRRKPVPSGTTKVIEIDLVIECVGVSPSKELPQSIEGLELKWGSVVVVDENQESSIPMLYAGGDASRGGATVVHAMRDGRAAARAIHARIQEMYN